MRINFGIFQYNTTRVKPNRPLSSHMQNSNTTLAVILQSHDVIKQICNECCCSIRSSATIFIVTLTYFLQKF